MVNIAAKHSGFHTVFEFFSRFQITFVAILLLCAAGSAYGQKTDAAMAKLGSQTAKNGFRNEAEIAAKLNNWRTVGDSRVWLAAMGYKLPEIESAAATKPDGQKADVEIRRKTTSGEWGRDPDRAGQQPERPASPGGGKGNESRAA